MLERDPGARLTASARTHGRSSGRQEISFTLGWDAARELGAIGPDTRRGKRFGKLGANSVICFPPNTLFNEQYIEIGSGTLFGPQVTLSAGMVPGQQMITDPVIRSAIVA